MAEFDELDKLTTHEEEEQSEAEPEPEPIDYNKASAYSSDPVERLNQLKLRSGLKSKLNHCRTLFKEELAGYEDRLTDIDNLPNEDLKLLLDEVKMAISVRRSSNLVKPLYFTGLEFIEKISCRFGYNIEGVHQMMYKNIEVHKCLDEISLDFDDSMYMPAYMRLGIITLQTVVGVYEMKRVEDTLKNEMSRKVKSEVVNEYKDL